MFIVTSLISSLIKQIDFNNLITSLTVTNTISYYTATQDCYINGRVSAKGGVGDGMICYVDSNNTVLGYIVGAATGMTSYDVGAYFNEFIKAGNKISLRSATNQTVKVYGVK